MKTLRKVRASAANLSGSSGLYQEIRYYRPMEGILQIIDFGNNLDGPQNSVAGGLPRKKCSCVATLIIWLNSQVNMDYEALKDQWSEVEDRDGVRLSWNTFPSSRMVFSHAQELYLVDCSSVLRKLQGLSYLLEPSILL